MGGNQISVATVLVSAVFMFVPVFIWLVIAKAVPAIRNRLYVVHGIAIAVLAITAIGGASSIGMDMGNTLLGFCVVALVIIIDYSRSAKAMASKKDKA